MHQVRLQQEAIEDIEAAYGWYEDAKEGLGESYMNEINKCIDKITSHPQHYKYINFCYRRIRVNRFPYYLIYEITDVTVIVYKCYHAKQNNSFK